MMYSQDRNQMRQAFIDAWKKSNSGEPLEAMEQIIADVVALHPEYHRMLDDSDTALGTEYLPEGGETNPFLHMGLHIAIREQLGANQPHGIQDMYVDIRIRIDDEHEAEHKMIDCLAEEMWRAQAENRVPDNTAYVTCLKKLGNAQ